MKVLVVDDSRTIRRIQRNVLAQLGYTDVLEACDGVEALRLIGLHTFDLLLVDWNMPNMDGITLIRKVRETHKALAIIMCTTESQKDRVMEAVRAGVNSYLVKPFDVDSLSEKIDQTLARAGQRA
jgi:two-component system chemotaxis response regulator CheY